MMQLIKSIVRWGAKLTPYEVRRRGSETWLPDASLDLIKCVLAYYLKTGVTARFVQIGACDGTSGDAVNQFIKSGRIEVVLVEPVEQMFLQLCKAFADLPTVKPMNVALAHHDGEVTMYRVREGAKSIAPHWARQLASFDRGHLLRHGVVAGEIESIQVPCLTLGSLLERCGFAEVDILQSDTEGFDAEVLKMALALPKSPDCIYFENTHLDIETRREVFARLAAADYSWAHDDWNSLAVHKRLIARWEGYEMSLCPEAPRTLE
jgi:FkbM family methyltransferase